MKTLAAIALLVAVVRVSAQMLPSGTDAARSLSGQFQVFAPYPIDVVRSAARFATSTNLVQLEPTLLAVSAERIKQRVWNELGLGGAWQGRVLFILRAARTADETVTVISQRGPAGWSYRVEMPDQLPKERFLRAVIHIALLEFANRSAGERAAEIPAWLSDGLAFEFLSNNSGELILAAPIRAANGVKISLTATEARRLSPLERAHKILIGTTPLTFEELSWPATGQRDGAAAPAFHACAQLFLDKLLDLRDGRACLRNFLTALPQYQNWQLAFLRGFRPHFARLLDVEKWWSLEAAHFTGHDLIQTWPYEESWTKLAAALRVPVDVFARSNALPVHTEVSLQTVLQEWGSARQTGAVRTKLDQLTALQPRLAPELVALATEYRQVLAAQLQRPGTSPVGKMNTRTADVQMRQAQTATIKLLNVLDARLEKMRPHRQPSAT